MLLFSPNHPRTVPLKEIFCERCSSWDKEPCWSHVKQVPDRVVLPYAIASLPPVLYPGISTSLTQAIFAKIPIERQTLFGPLVAPFGATAKECKYALKDERNREIHHFQLENDKLSNWMKFVRFAENPNEQNVAVYSREGQVYFVTTRRIEAKEELKVGYSKKYADSFDYGSLASTNSQNTPATRAESPEIFAPGRSDENVNTSHMVRGLDVLLDSCLSEFSSTNENLPEIDIPVAKTSPSIPAPNGLPCVQESVEIRPPLRIRTKPLRSRAVNQPILPSRPLASSIALTVPPYLIENIHPPKPSSLPADPLSNPSATEGPFLLIARPMPSKSHPVDMCIDNRSDLPVNVFLPSSLPPDSFSDLSSADEPMILITRPVPSESPPAETCVDDPTTGDDVTMNDQSVQLERIMHARRLRRDDRRKKYQEYQEKHPDQQKEKRIRQREKCPVCETVVNRDKVVTHLKDRHPEYCQEKFRFECLHCFTVWPTDKSVRYHVAMAHPHLKLTATIPRDAAARDEAIDHLKTTGDFTFYCTSCRQHFPKKSMLQLHKLRHRGNEPLESRPDRNCPCCPYVAQNFADLVEHSRHHSVASYEAKPCMFCSEAVLDVKEHVMEHHSQIFEDVTKDWTSRCEQCGSRFNTHHRLHLHMRSHTGLQCLYCAKLFQETVHLSAHTREHKVDDRFPCPFCKKLFPNYTQMRVHYRDMHDVKSMRKCDVCEQVLKNKPMWLFHMKKFHPADAPKRTTAKKKYKKKGKKDALADRQDVAVVDESQHQLEHGK